MKTAVRRGIRVPADGKILVLSPHSDDAALSVGGLIQKPAFRNSIHILTLFGRSNYTRAGGFQDNWQTVSKRRKSEDTAFAARVGVELTYLDFPFFNNILTCWPHAPPGTGIASAPYLRLW